MKAKPWREEAELAEAAAIVRAIRRLRRDAGLRAEARANLPAALDRLHLGGIARQAVAAALVVALINPDALPIQQPNIFWV
jgi:hypothetical protein